MLIFLDKKLEGTERFKDSHCLLFTSNISVVYKYEQIFSRIFENSTKFTVEMYRIWFTAIFSATA